jgi:uncharacterized protein (TIGR02246 family)
MNKLLMVIPLVFLLCFTFGCQQGEEVAEEPLVDVAAEEEAIRKLTTDWFADELSRDMEASLSYLAPDAMFQFEGAPTVVGTTAIRAAYEEIFKLPFTDWMIEPRTVVVAASGDLAYDIGSFKMVFEGPEGRTEAPQKSTIIWRKLEDQWKVAICCFSSDTPPGPTSE